MIQSNLNGLKIEKTNLKIVEKFKKKKTKKQNVFKIKNHENVKKLPPGVVA